MNLCDWNVFVTSIFSLSASENLICRIFSFLACLRDTLFEVQSWMLLLYIFFSFNVTQLILIQKMNVFTDFLFTLLCDSVLYILLLASTRLDRKLISFFFQCQFKWVVVRWSRLFVLSQPQTNIVKSWHNRAERKEKTEWNCSFSFIINHSSLFYYHGTREVFSRLVWIYGPRTERRQSEENIVKCRKCTNEITQTK